MGRLIQNRVGYKRVCKRGQLSPIGVKTGVATINGKMSARRVLLKTINPLKLNAMLESLNVERRIVLKELIKEIEQNPNMPVEDIFLKVNKKMRTMCIKYSGASTKLYYAAVKSGAIKVGG